MEVDEYTEAGDQLKARPYQAQLEEIADKHNTIIYLPTGLSNHQIIFIKL